MVTRDASIEQAPGSKRSPLSLFVVPKNTPGLVFQPLETALVNPDRQFTVFFDDVKVGPEALIGAQGRGLRQVFAGLNPERILASSLSNGIGRYAIAKATVYAKDRKVWDVAIGSHQASHIRWRKHMSPCRWRVSPRSAVPHFTTPDSMLPKLRTWRSSSRRMRRSKLSIRPSRCTEATG